MNKFIFADRLGWFGDSLNALILLKVQAIVREILVGQGQLNPNFGGGARAFLWSISLLRNEFFDCDNSGTQSPA